MYTVVTSKVKILVYNTTFLTSPLTAEVLSNRNRRNYLTYNVQVHLSYDNIPHLTFFIVFSDIKMANFNIF